MHVVATAGHVDHGKSALVRALTGSDPDRLEEERRRGLSIQLGYAWTTLPEVGNVAFVDVPGHERFISTMLAGIGPVPAVLFVVAADDPWMPQAAEHLAALNALGVEHGVVAVTRSDLADPAQAVARATAELRGTSLRGSPVVAVSSRTGAGLEELRTRLVELVNGLPATDPDADVRLWVDRRFTISGAGTVVTGTLAAGTIARGDTLSTGEGTVRVRGVESLEQPVKSVRGVARVALNLTGDVADLTRSSTLTTPEAFLWTEVLDVRVVGDVEGLPTLPVLHVGALSLTARCRPLAGDLVRLTLAHPLPLRIGDRALLRDPGSRAIWGIQVLDPLPPPLRRRGAAASRAVELRGLDGSVASYAAMRGLVRRDELRRIGAVGDPSSGTVLRGDWLVDPARAAELSDRLVGLVGSQPGTARLTTAAAAHALGLPDAELVSALVRPPLLERGGELTTDDQLEAVSPWEPALRELRPVLEQDPFAAPDTHRLRELGLDLAAQSRLHRDGRLLRLAENVVLLPGADELAVERLRELPQPFTTSQARQRLGTTRRVVLPLLAHLDRARRTVRLPDDTRRLV